VTNVAEVADVANVADARDDLDVADVADVVELGDMEVSKEDMDLPILSKKALDFISKSFKFAIVSS